MLDKLYHPVKEIEGRLSNALSGRTIVLGLTSSSAIYRSIDVARELIRRGARVVPVMSPESTKLISPTLFAWATGEEVFTEFKGEVGHIGLSYEASSMLICPATANTLAKIASGISDTSVTLVATAMLGSGKEVVVVPAMHSNLWASPAVRKAVKELVSMGVTVVPPKIEEGKAKLPSLVDIVAATEAVTLRGKDLKGLKILVTAGATREWLDKVRFLTNPSSGRMGLSIAREAFFRGASVTLIYGDIRAPEPVPHYVKSIRVDTTEEMLRAVLNEVTKNEYDVVILAAAPSDFKFSKTFGYRLSASDAPIELSLLPTPKISLEVRKVFKGLLVGFSAEYAGGSEDVLIERARKKMQERMFDIIVANDISRKDVGFSSPYNEVVIIPSDGAIVKVKKDLKSVIARAILDQIKKYIKGLRT